jgi:hypothetical protein
VAYGAGRRVFVHHVTATGGTRKRLTSRADNADAKLRNLAAGLPL